MGLTKHSARSRCLVADNLLFAVIAIICKCCVADDAILSALRERAIAAPPATPGCERARRPMSVCPARGGCGVRNVGVLRAVAYARSDLDALCAVSQRLFHAA